MRSLKIINVTLLLLIVSASVTNANLTLNSSGSVLAAGVGKISNLAQGTTPRQVQFGIRLAF